MKSLYCNSHFLESILLQPSQKTRKGSKGRHFEVADLPVGGRTPKIRTEGVYCHDRLLEEGLVYSNGIF